MMGAIDKGLFGEEVVSEALEHLTYPDQAGHKGDADTGREAAEAMNDKLGRLQRLVRELLTQRGALGITPEEAAGATGIDRVSLQPRFSELRAKGVIADSGHRRTNPSSKRRAVVWVLRRYVAKPEGDV